MNLFCLDFSINDYSLTIRNILTKGTYHEEITKISGAACKLRGKYIANSNQRNSRNQNKTEKPLYLSLQGKSQESVDLAVHTIREKIESETQKSLKIARMMKNNDQYQSPTQQLNKLMIGLDYAPATFDLKNRIVGSNGTNLNYIRNETGAMVTLRGRSSMFIDPTTGTESNEPLHLFIDHNNGENLLEARQLAKNLIETIQQDLTIFQQNLQKPNQQMTLIQNNQNGPPPPILSVPPPSHMIQSQAAQNFIQTNQPPQGQIIQQQTQNVPMQIIQQIPPPAIPQLRSNQPIVQLQQQPANIQIQGANGQPTQILVNQAPQQFQYHIQQNPNSMQINQNPTQQVIQHFISPQQQIQGLQGIIQTPIQSFDQFRPQGTQQIITVQGNSFMIPPPMIQNQAPQQNIIYHHQPAQQQIIHQMPIEMNNQEDPNIKKDMGDKDKDGIVQIHQQMPTNTRTILTGPMIQLNHPPPILSVPPPNMQIISHPTPVSHPNQQQQQQIFGNQIPVTIQQHIQVPQQGQHFIVNSQWQPNNNQHQFTQAPMIQAPQTRNCNEMMVNEQVVQQNDFRGNPQQIITFNPQMQTNMQIQFHQPPQNQQPNLTENHHPNFNQVQPPQFQQMRQNNPMEQHNMPQHMSHQQLQNNVQPHQRPGIKRKMNDDIIQPDPPNPPKIKGGVGPKSAVVKEGSAAPQPSPMMPMFNNKMKSGNNSMKLNVNNYNNKPINKFNKIAATSAANISSTNIVSQIKSEPAPTTDDVEDSKIGIKQENSDVVEHFEGQKNQPQNQGQMVMINQPPGNHLFRSPGNGQNFRFGPPGNNFMGQQQQSGQFQQGPQMMQHPPPNFQQGSQFNQPRMMMNNFHQNQQLMSSQGGPPMQHQQQRPFMQDMRNFGGPPPPPPAPGQFQQPHNEMGNFQQMMHHPQQGPRFRQQW